MYKKDFMQRAIELSAEALQTNGSEPFGAVVVKEGVIVGEGFNHSVAHFDPTSHGEVEAIRDACKNLKTVDLAGCELYTSCEPCALCVAAMSIAGIRRVFYAASLEQSGKAFENLDLKHRHPIDVDALRHEAGTTLSERSIPFEQAMDQEAVAVLQAWAAPRSIA
jgi:guanine deaminase